MSHRFHVSERLISPAATPATKTEDWRTRFDGLFRSSHINTSPTPSEISPETPVPEVVTNTQHVSNTITSLPQANLPQIDRGSFAVSKATTDQIFYDDLSFGSMPKVSVPRNIYRDAPLQRLSQHMDQTTPMVYPTVVEIARHGDVILICTEKQEPNTTYRLRTSSHVLQLGSSVFSAMLGPHFKEGKALATTGTVEIALPDDVPQAMITMCKIMHLDPNIMDQVPTAGELALLARHADKYDTVRALGTATWYWISEAISKDDPTTRGILLGAAYAFKHAELFDRAGRAIVMRCLAPKALQVGEHPENLPGLLLKVQKCRDRLLGKFSSTIDLRISVELRGAGLINSQHHGGRPCDCPFAQMMTFNFIRQLHHDGLWPHSDMLKQTLEAAIETAKLWKLSPCGAVCSCHHGCIDKEAKTIPIVSKKIKDMADQLGKLITFCLKCEQDGATEFGSKCGHR